MNRLIREFQKQPAGCTESSPHQEEQPVFPSPDDAEDFAAVTGNIERAIDTSIEAEKRAMAYFEYLRDATLDSNGHKAFDRLYKEEEKHLKLLTELKASL